MSKPKFNYILNDLAFSNLQTRCLYTECTEQDIVEFENQLKLKEQELQKKDNIINELKTYLNKEIESFKLDGYDEFDVRQDSLWLAGCYDEDKIIFKKIKELEERK